jgi:hypothetical protein
MAKNIFKNLPTDQHENLKKIVSNRVGQKLREYTRSRDYTFDVIANRVNKQGRKIALAEVNNISLQVAASTIKGDPNKVIKQFKAFVKSDTGVLSDRYNWNVLQRRHKMTYLFFFVIVCLLAYAAYLKNNLK